MATLRWGGWRVSLVPPKTCVATHHMTMTKSEAEALFVLAGIPVHNMKPLPDGYDYDPAQDMRYFDHPPTRVWWFIKTPCGWVEIGWRLTGQLFACSLW